MISLPHKKNPLVQKIKQWGKTLGFEQVGITDPDCSSFIENYMIFLNQNHHGEMTYLARNREKRFDPIQLVEETKSIISVSMNYFVEPETNIARYARGKDYHKLIRKRLQKLADKIKNEIGDFKYRAFTDSAPVLEKAIAEKAGLGWIGKNTMLLNQEHGSWFFLGELFTNLSLPVDRSMKNRCGSCEQCILHCPTKAIIAPYQLDARRCISYLTIEYRGIIPEELRPLIGTHIYGCDECQSCCPWNRFSKQSEEKAFQPRAEFDTDDLIDFFLWEENDFLKKTEGTAIRRIGYKCWLRNVAIALGNSPKNQKIIKALQSRSNDPSELISIHTKWALKQGNP